MLQIPHSPTKGTKHYNLTRITLLRIMLLNSKVKVPLCRCFHCNNRPTEEQSNSYWKCCCGDPSPEAGQSRKTSRDLAGE